MKVLVIGGNRFVGARFTHALARAGHVDLAIVNRTGQAPHAPGAAVYKVNRDDWTRSYVDRDWDVVVDFACFNEAQARGALEYFGSVGRYVFISSASVYDPGASLSERAFDPATAEFLKRGAGTYQDDKRRAEIVFTREAKFPVTSVRFPFLLGPDDYTRRLEFHVERVAAGRPFFAPSLDARFSVLHAEDAARFLEWNLTQSFTGAVNVAAPQPIALRELLGEISRRCGRQPLNVRGAEPSPYGVERDWFVDVSACQRLGFRARPWRDWLGDLIEGALGRGGEGQARLH